MDNTRFKLAVLRLLAKCPGRRATFDDVRREVEIQLASTDPSEPPKGLSALSDVDIFESGLVLQDDTGLQVTAAGLSLLHSLETNSELSRNISSSPASRHGGHAKDREAKIVPPNATLETSAVGPCEKIEIPEGINDDTRSRLSPNDENRTNAIEGSEGASQDAPTFLRRSFGPNVVSERNPPLLARLLALIDAKRQSMAVLWRRHIVQDSFNQKTELLVGKKGGAAFAILSLFMVAACFGAAIALGQIKSLKSEIALLYRELGPLRERLGQLEQSEKRKTGADPQVEARSNGDTNKPGRVSDQTALNLSWEEVQLIREYIKPAPSAGIISAAINVGDLIGGATIPLPSPITEKVPKLIGGRFTTRNGAIIISTKNSRRADAVLISN